MLFTCTPDEKSALDHHRQQRGWLADYAEVDMMGVRYKSHLTQRIYSSVLESQLPHNTVNPIFY